MNHISLNQNVEKTVLILSLNQIQHTLTEQLQALIYIRFH